MTQMAGTAFRSRDEARGITVPAIVVACAGAFLALAVAAVHVADQGGVSAFADPAWIGWSYRLIEVGGVLTALVLLLNASTGILPAWTGWAAGVLLGAGPFIAYLLTRTTGLPGDSGDVGNWGDWVGTVALLVEAGLVVLSISMLLSALPRSGARGRRERRSAG